MPGIITWLVDWIWSGWLILLAAVLLGIAVGILLSGNKPITIVRQIDLRDLSILWTKDTTRTIHISELSPLWREDQVVESKVLSAEPLRHPRALELANKMDQWAFFEKFPNQKTVCLQILRLLDQEGDCSSVVNVQGDVEGTWDENTYRLLGQTTLLDHSINVAEQVVDLLAAQNALHVIPDALIAALGHDLGKLESLRGFLYSLGEHPLASGRPLAGMTGFQELPKKEEILQAIKLHHKRPNGLLGKTLKRADQLARQKELETVAVSHDGKQKNDGAEPGDQRAPVAGDTTAADMRATAAIYGNEDDPPEPQKTEVPELVDISGWFDAAGFIDKLKPYINKMFGRRFMAFSMPDGHVYFQVKVLEEVARKQAEKAGCMEIATMALRDESMRGVLLAIVHRLRMENDIIARGLIKDNYFGGYFMVDRKIGKPIKGYYTPFHAEAFGSIAEMELAKPDMLSDIIRVTPYEGNQTMD